MKLSVQSAAAEAGTRTALVIDGRATSFADLAQRVLEGGRASADHPPGLARPIVCRPDLDSLIELYACLEARVPAALLSPKISPERERALRDAVAASRFALPSGANDRAAAMALVFTSGSSGEPKAVELSRAAFEAAADASTARLSWREDDRWLLGLSFAHVGGLSILTRCLAARRAVVALSSARFSARELAGAIERDRVTLLSLVPAQLHQFLDLAPAWKPPSHLRAVLLGGAAADAELLREGRERGWPLLCTYGMTEACSQIATQLPEEITRPLDREPSLMPLPGFELRIVEGAIQVRSPTLLTAYQPPGTHAEPRTPDGWLATQDLGRLDSRGGLEVLGRRDEMIVTGGEKVMPAEVERVVASCPGIGAVCAFGLPDPVWGQLVAAAVVVTEPPLDLAQLRQAIQSRLASHQRPRRLAVLEALPLTASGKVDRRALASLSPERLAMLEFS